MPLHRNRLRPLVGRTGRETRASVHLRHPSSKKNAGLRLRAGGAGTANLGAEPIYRSLAFTEGVPILVAEDELALANEILGELDLEE
jgi:hypothetical protein